MDLDLSTCMCLGRVLRMVDSKLASISHGSTGVCFGGTLTSTLLMITATTTFPILVKIGVNHGSVPTLTLATTSSNYAKLVLAVTLSIKEKKNYVGIA